MRRGDQQADTAEQSTSPKNKLRTGGGSAFWPKGQLCNDLLHNLLVGAGQGQFPHATPLFNRSANSVQVDLTTAGGFQLPSRIEGEVSAG